MDSVESQYIIKFINEFIKKEKSIVDHKIQHDYFLLSELISGFNELEKKAQEFKADHSPGFNIFKIVGVSHLEAKVHTPILVEFLNPAGEHRQGRLYFDAFMVHLFGDKYRSDEVQNISIHKEFSDYKNGRMDILIRYHENQIRKEIVIENKIYHDDGDGQVEKYFTYLTKTRGLLHGEFCLIYLTPHRRRPHPKSINPQLYSEMIKGNSLREWGYYEDIECFLKKTVTATKAPGAKQLLIQYIDAIKFL